MTSTDSDRFDTTMALGARGLLQAFNAAGVLSASDVHVARRLAELSGTEDDAVALGVAFAARAPRLGHVCVDLATVARTASADTDVAVDLNALPWPEAAPWTDLMAASDLVGPERPLRLEGSVIYLDRLWADEQLVAADLVARAARSVAPVGLALLAAGLDGFFDPDADPDPDLQRMAAATAVLRHLTVIAGGPGTGKTTTVARVLALIDAQAAAAGERAPLVALAAPTGKAAARLEEAVRTTAAEMTLDDVARARLLEVRGVTLHRLLGRNPGNHTRFRHNRRNRLAHDVVVVDETSMVSLSMMARLLEAVRPDARLILVGDPEQLASVEAGSVLGDIVGPAARGLRMRPAARAELGQVAGQAVPATDPPGDAVIGDGIVVLRRIHRFSGTIARLAEAIEAGDSDRVMEVLGGANDDDVQWVSSDAADPAAAAALATVRAIAVETGRHVIDAARAGDASAAITALGDFRLLCAHRRGPQGVATWMQQVENWLRADVDGFSTGTTWYVGRPLLVTENDYSLELYNGDTGVVIEREGGRLVAAFDRGGQVIDVSPTRLAAVDTVYAMTVHKSQGSQFDTVVFLLPDAASPILTRELLYTAVTRARKRLIVIGTEASLRAAVERPIARASGLRQALWGAGD